MKTRILFLCFFFGCMLSFAQEVEDKITEAEWDVLIGKLSKEQWNEAEQLTTKYLEKFTEKDSLLAEPAIVRYMYFRCVSAKLGEKEYTKEEAENKLKPLVGKAIITPPKTFLEKGMFNCLKLNDDHLSLTSCNTNIDKTIIHAFETYEMEDVDLLKDYKAWESKSFRLGGFIKEIRAEGFAMPRIHITFKKTFIWE